MILERQCQKLNAIQYYFSFFIIKVSEETLKSGADRDSIDLHQFFTPETKRILFQIMLKAEISVRESAGSNDPDLPELALFL